MTSKHFEALALALKNTKPCEVDTATDDWATDLAALSQWRADVRAVAEVCIDHNPRFGPNRFYAACGYEIEGVKS